jgi:hypothetical protein
MARTAASLDTESGLRGTASLAGGSAGTAATLARESPLRDRVPEWSPEPITEPVYETGVYEAGIYE